ncbi:MAG: HAD family hydrolase [Pseudomonadota bacterium]
MDKNLLIFDLDGTLADTAPDLVATLNRITSSFGLQPVEVGQVGQIVGFGAKVMIERAFAINNRELTQAMHDKLFNTFLEDYADNLAVESRLFEGVAETISSLQAQGFIATVCTNKPEAMARELLKELGIFEAFAAITGGDTFPFRKPDARHLEETVKLAGCSLKSAIMIGDSIADINAAKNAGIPSVAVTFGYSDVPVEDLRPDHIISQFSQLEDVLRRVSAESQTAIP